MLDGVQPQREQAICATDPALAIDWPVVDGIALRMSERDADAPSLEQVRAAGLLPSCNETRTFVDRLRRDPRCLAGFGVDGW